MNCRKLFAELVISRDADSQTAEIHAIRDRYWAFCRTEAQVVAGA